MRVPMILLKGEKIKYISILINKYIMISQCSYDFVERLESFILIQY